MNDADWNMAIERNRAPLLRIVATLFAVIGLAEGKAIERLAWPLYRAVLGILKPAESAVRRLIVIAARNLVVKPPPVRPTSKQGKVSRTGKRQGQGKGRAVFRLIDPRKHFDLVYDPSDQGELAPRLYGFASPVQKPLFHNPPAMVPAPDGMVKAVSLCRRLQAIKAALEDLGHQARRYARWRAKPIEERRPPVISSLRPGHAPGWRRKATHEVDLILNECHEMAYYLPQPKPDTS